MLSKEAKLRRRINRVYRKTLTKDRGPKDGYRWFDFNNLKRGQRLPRVFRFGKDMNPERLVSWASMAKALASRYGEFDPYKNTAELTKAVYPEPPQAEPPSNREVYLHELSKRPDSVQMPHKLRVELEYLRITRTDGKLEVKDAYSRILSDEEIAGVKRPGDEVQISPVAQQLQAKPGYLENEPSFLTIRRDQINVRPYEAPAPISFYDSLVAGGFIQPGDPLPEDPPEGWEPPEDGAFYQDDPMPLMEEEDQAPEPQLRETDLDDDY